MSTSSVTPPPGPFRPFVARRSGLFALLVVAVCLMVATPFLTVRDIVLLDYQNHLARLALLMDAGPARLALKFYQVDWSHMSTDIGVDLIAQVLKDISSPDAVGRAALIAAAVLPPLGAVALNAAVFRRPSPHQFAIPFFAWSITTLAGFLNFQIGLGLAFLFAALAAAARADQPMRRAAALALGGLLVYLFHALDFCLFVALAIAVTIDGAGRVRPRTPAGRSRPPRPEASRRAASLSRWRRASRPSWR